MASFMRAFSDPRTLDSRLKGRCKSHVPWKEPLPNARRGGPILCSQVIQEHCHYFIVTRA